MKTPNMEQRLRLLAEKVQTQYDSLGHSPRNPYLSFVYDPDDEGLLPELLFKYFHEDESLAFTLIDLLPVTIESFEGDDEGRSQALNDPLFAETARHEIVQLWSEVLCERIVADVAGIPIGKRPVVILYGTAALHPLGTPTDLMAFVAETEPSDERTGRAVPIVIFVPGYSPRYLSSQLYHFLDPEGPLLQFYRGTEGI